MLESQNSYPKSGKRFKDQQKEEEEEMEEEEENFEEEEKEKDEVEKEGETKMRKKRMKGTRRKRRRKMRRRKKNFLFTQPLIQWVPGAIYIVIKRPEHEAHRLLLPNAGVKIHGAILPLLRWVPWKESISVTGPGLNVVLRSPDDGQSEFECRNPFHSICTLLYVLLCIVSRRNIKSHTGSRYRFCRSSQLY
jgi:hypothetical protein